MRLRTLPVSVAGVIAACAYAVAYGVFSPVAAGLCLSFAVLSQIASNFANEYFDYRDGLDRPGREGPRRGVTEGDISPRTMLLATIITLAAGCIVGLVIAWIGGLWLIALGILIALGVFAYSAGPYPLSRHALGEVAVIFFFGIIPVTLTFYVMSGFCTWLVFAGSVAVGLMGANVLLVNNYRDAPDDASVGKITLVVKWGRKIASTLYLFNGYIAVALMVGMWFSLPRGWRLIPVVYLLLHTMLWHRMTTVRGHALNPLLGMTAMLMMAYAIFFLVACGKIVNFAA